VNNKERILQFIEFKDIKKSSFLEETTIKRGFLDSDKLNQAISDENLTKIIVTYPDVSLEWILTGKGEMLRSNVTDPLPTPIYNEKEKPNDGMLELLKEQLKEKDTIIKDLNREIGVMTADNATLKKRISEVIKHRDRAMAILESSELPNHYKLQLLTHLEGADRLLMGHL